MKIKNKLACFFSFLTICFILAIVMLTCSDNGAKLTMDYLPLTSTGTYIFLAAGALISAIIVFIAESSSQK